MDTKKLFNRTNYVLFIAAIVGFVCLFNYLGTRFFVRADLTSNKMYTISSGTRKVLRGLDDLVTLKVFISEKDLPPLAINMVRSIKDLLSEYEAYGHGNLNVIFVDPTDDNDKKNEARSLGLQEVPMQVIEKDKQQNVMCFMGLAILYGDKKEILPVLNNVGNLEYELTSRVLKLTRTEVKRVGFFFGNGAHSFTPEGMPPQQERGAPQTTWNTLKKEIQEQFEVAEVTGLDQGTAVPADITTLVVAGPKSLTEREKFEIDQFVMRGGKLVACVDAVEIQTTMGVNAVKQAHNSGDLFSHWGAKVNQDVVADGRAHSSITYQVNYGGFMLPMSQPYPLWVNVIKDGFARDNPAVSTLNSVTLMWPSSVDITKVAADSAAKADTSGVRIVPLLSTTRFAKAMEDNFDLNPRREWAGYFNAGLKSYHLGVVLNGVFPSFYAGKPVPMVKPAGDPTGQAPLAPAPGDDARNRPDKSAAATSVVLIGDSDFLNDGGPRENLVFMTNLLEWLTLGDNLIGIRSKNVADRMLDPRLAGGTKSAIRLVNTILMPLFVIALGVAVLLRRRNRMSKGA